MRVRFGVTDAIPGGLSMSAYAPVITSTGLATSVGLTAPASCAAIRAKLTNPFETRFIDSGGQWIRGHRVPLEQPWSGRTKLKKMAVRVISECLADISPAHWSQIPLLLCVAERERPGRTAGLEEELYGEICGELGVRFDEQSIVIPKGRVSGSIALLHARRMISEARADSVLIVATDSLLSWPSVSAYERADRLLTSVNSNGFLPGEAAGAVLVGDPKGGGSQLFCIGLGFGEEPASIDSESPLRGDGLTQAIRNALGDAGCQIQELDLRIGDLSGEQYYFKEASLAVSRLLRVRKEEFPIWHHAECIGECGSSSSIVAFIIASLACQKGYAPGPRILCHAAADTTERAAAIFEFRAAQ
jgi:3-oxoacyl-[acyl-carrier-protein] synthase-1